MLRKILLAASAVAMVASPLAAQAADRTASPVSAKEELAGIPTFGVLIALAVVIAAAVVIAGDSNENDQPASP